MSKDAKDGDHGHESKGPDPKLIFGLMLAVGIGLMIATPGLAQFFDMVKYYQTQIWSTAALICLVMAAIYSITKDKKHE